MTALPGPISDWFATKGWQVRRHQHEMLAAARDGKSALLVAPTGAGKTLAGFLPSLVELVERPSEGLHTLYISPLKALAVDVQRNLLTPIEEMALPIRVEPRTGDTPADRKTRQRLRPPQMLLTTPESLSLLLSHEDSVRLFANLSTIVVDEIHAFATGKRGDLLALAMARLQTIAPGLRRVGLSATVADVEAYQGWLAPHGDIDTVRLVRGDPGADPRISIMLPEDERIPWYGHSGRWAAARVMAEIERHRTTLVFCNTRSLAELTFQDLWTVNESALPIGLHRLDEPSEAILVPGNRFEDLEGRAALDAIEEGELDAEVFRPGALDVLAQHVMAVACAAPFHEKTLLDEVRGAAPYAGLDEQTFSAILAFIENGGYALRAYDRFKRLTRDPDGSWRVSHPRFIQQHRMNAGIIVDAPLLDVRFRNGRKLGTVEDYFASTLSVGDTFFFAGLVLEVERMQGTEIIVRATSRSARIPTYVGVRMAMTTHLADRVRRFLAEPEQWRRFPDDVREWLEIQQRRSRLPEPDQLLVETFPHEGRHYMVIYSFEGWNAHQSLGMLVTRRMETAGLKPLGFVSNDYALACYGLEPIADPRALLSADLLEDEFVEWVQGSNLLKRAFREVAVIGGLVERHHPGKRKSGRQVTFSTDLIYDVLRRYEPDHLLLRAAWDDARSRLTDVRRLASLLERAVGTMLHVDIDRISPMAVPVMVMIGREAAPPGAAEDELLIEAESLADVAMRLG